MKKIFMSILAIALTVGAVSGTAYALFSDTVTIQGITMTAGNADFTIDGLDNIDGKTLGEDSMTNPLIFAGLYPGFNDYGTFVFHNKSEADISLSFKAKLTSAAGDWSYLKDAIKMAIKTEDGATFLTNWYTLAEWNAGEIAFGSPLTQGASVTYRVVVNIPTTIGNTIADKSLTDVKFVVTGTQN